MESERLAEKTLKILLEKSQKALELAKKMILEEKIGLKKTDEAVKYYLSRWNDTTRPGMLSIACEAVGGNSEEVVPLQMALLFIDATMDIHDDIIDGSAVKDDRQTIYGKFGKETALLIGNAFMVKGFNRLYRTLENLPKDQRLLIIDTVKDFLLEVVNAHILEAQLKDKKWKIKPETYLQVLTMKAVDIEGHMKIGAIYGGGSQKEIHALSKYGRNLGVLLAVRSDFVDVFEPNELLNKVRYECLPLPILYALQDEKYKKRIRGILLKNKMDETDCSELVEIIYKTKETSLLKQYLSGLEKEALQVLNTLPRSQVKSKLGLIIASMLEDL